MTAEPPRAVVENRAGIGRSAPRRVEAAPQQQQKGFNRRDWYRIGGLSALTVLVCVSRVMGSHHTLQQVVAGVCLGAVAAAICAVPAVTRLLIRPFAQRIILPVFQLLHELTFP